MSKFLDELAVFVKEKGYNTIRISEIIGSNQPETVEFQSANPCQNSYSVAKTYAMTAIGLLYDKGLISLDEKICDILSAYLPESGMDNRWFDCTVRMALTHSLGLPGGFLDIDVNPASLFGFDYLDYTFKTQLIFDPGTESRYTDGAFYLLSRIVYEKTGLKTDDFLWREMLYKLGYQEFAWSHCPAGHPMGGTGVYVRSEDMAKLGAVYLNNGVYNGERLLSEEWVHLASENCFALDWNEDKTVYYKGGMCGQKLIIAPDQNRVLAIHSFGADTGAIMNWMEQNGN